MTTFAENNAIGFTKTADIFEWLREANPLKNLLQNAPPKSSGWKALSQLSDRELDDLGLSRKFLEVMTNDIDSATSKIQYLKRGLHINGKPW